MTNCRGIRNRNIRPQYNFYDCPGFRERRYEVRASPHCGAGAGRATLPQEVKVDPTTEYL